MIQVRETTDSRLLAELNKEIRTLHNQLYPALFKPYDRTRILLAFAQLVADSATKALAIFQDSVPVGYALFSVKTKKESVFTYGYQLLYIDQILVLNQNRSQGLGKVLLNHVYAEGKALGINRIELDHWTLNEDARFFFHAVEFQYFNEKMFKTLD